MKHLKLIYWVEKNKTRFNIKTIRETWTSQLGVGYCSTICSIELDGEFHLGRGLHKDSSLSYAIAISEMLERVILMYNKLPSSNGVAVHTDENEAKQRAKYELIERDTYMYHYITKSALQDCKNETSFYKEIKQAFSKVNVDMKLYTIPNSFGLHTVMCAAEGFKCNKAFGFVLGLGCNESIDKAINSAISEATHMCATFISTDYIAHINLESFTEKTKEHGLVEAHYQLGLNIDYAKKYKKHFMQTSSSPQEKDTSDLGDFFIQRLEIPDFLNIDFEYYAYLAKNPKLQSIFWGHTDEKKINMKRFETSTHFKLEEQIAFLKEHPHIFA